MIAFGMPAELPASPGRGRLAVCSSPESPADCTVYWLLRRRPVMALFLTHGCRESNRLEELEAGLVHDPDEIYTEYQDPAHDPWGMLLVPVLRHVPRSQLVAETGLARSTLSRLRNGHTQPHLAHRAVLVRAVGAFARERLAAAGRPVPREDLAACAEWLAWKDG